MKRFILLLNLLILAFLTASGQNDYERRVNNWRTAHEAEINSENGWLTVAGLFWLKDGVNTIGAGPNYDVALPETFRPGKFGEINFQNNQASLKVADGVEASSDGKTLTAAELVSDENGKPNVITSGGLSFFLIKRENRFGIRLKDKNSPKKLAFSGLHWFPVDSSYRVTARFEAFATSKEVAIPNVLGGSFKMKSPGILKFKLKGKQYSLQPVEEDDQLFIIFRDLSSKTETYGAGRFLYAPKPVKGKVVLDFNQAENPPCAFTSFATCPLPPPQNRLEVEIKAGEKRYDH